MKSSMFAVQLVPSGAVEKLQPCVIRGNGLLFSGCGGYICAPMHTHSDSAKPDSSPAKPP